MSTFKWYAHRAVLLMGTLTAFAVIIGNGAKRW